MSLDARVTPLRDGIAHRMLEGVEPAEVYLDPTPMACAAPAAAIRRAPDSSSEQMDQLLFGEVFEAVEEEGAFVWGRARRDGYVGFVEAASLEPAGPAPTHRVTALRTYAFAGPSIKTRASGPYSLGSLAAVDGQEGRLSHVAGAGWMASGHLAPIGEAFETDPAAVAERYLGAPYLWGGRESLGLDCSGLVLQALLACGRACPRDTDQQAAGLGRAIAAAEFGRADLVFWKGHVAIGLGEGRIIHANAWRMAVAVEPLDAAITRIAAGGLEVTGYRRI